MLFFFKLAWAYIKVMELHVWSCSLCNYDGPKSAFSCAFKASTHPHVRHLTFSMARF